MHKQSADCSVISAHNDHSPCVLICIDIDEIIRSAKKKKQNLIKNPPIKKASQKQKKKDLKVASETQDLAGQLRVTCIHALWLQL